jgi:hypothetical protein
VTIDEVVRHLADGATLEGPHWTEPVKVLAVKARGSRLEVQAVGLHTKRLWNKLLKAEDFDGAVKITQAGELAALTGNPTHFRLAAEAWCGIMLSAIRCRIEQADSNGHWTFPQARSISWPPPRKRAVSARREVQPACP